MESTLLRLKIIEKLPKTTVSNRTTQATTVHACSK